MGCDVSVRKLLVQTFLTQILFANAESKLRPLLRLSRR
jgi:hypothetical protein